MYPSNLSDQAWSEIEHFFKRSDPRGAKSVHSKYTVVNAVFYVVKTGCQWRMLPLDFPPWQSVYDHYRRWNKRGIWQEVLDFLNVRTRLKQAKKPSPSYAIVDSQSVKTQYACKERGIDGGKKSKGVNAISVSILWPTFYM